MIAKNTKCGFVAVIGAPNAGKSTLVNALTGHKVSIVTPKAQTTRDNIKGIRIYNNSQIIFVDTPGIFKIKGKLNNNLNKKILAIAKSSFSDVDAIIYLVDSSKKSFSENDEEILNILKYNNVPKILVLNKIDITKKERLLNLSMNLNSKTNFDKTFMVSAVKKNGIEDILNYISKTLPNSPFLYDKNHVTDFPERSLAAEITREKLFLNIHEELPYNIMVETDSFEKKKAGIVINQSIFTVNESHKSMIIGNKGALIKKIGEQARKELSEIFGRKVHLYLFVKIRENWVKNIK